MKPKNLMIAFFLCGITLTACLPALPVAPTLADQVPTETPIQGPSAATPDFVISPLPTPLTPGGDQPEATLGLSTLTETPEGATATATPTTTETLTVSPNQSPSPTSKPGEVRVSVSVPTNCRSGPGIVYSWLGALLVGESSQVIARNSLGNYWYIRNPDVTGGYCWLWDEYATVTGNTSALPIYTAAPAPTVTGVGTPSGATRLYFATGATSVSTSGSLPQNGVHVYSLRALAGQTMTVYVTSKWDMLLEVSAEDGSLLKASGPASPPWSGYLPKNQLYYLTLRARDGLAASYDLKVVIPPK